MREQRFESQDVADRTSYRAWERMFPRCEKYCLRQREERGGGVCGYTYNSVSSVYPYSIYLYYEKRCEGFLFLGFMHGKADAKATRHFKEFPYQTHFYRLRRIRMYCGKRLNCTKRDKFFSRYEVQFYCYKWVSPVS